MGLLPTTAIHGISFVGIEARIKYRTELGVLQPEMMSNMKAEAAEEGRLADNALSSALWAGAGEGMVPPSPSKMLPPMSPSWVCFLRGGGLPLLLRRELENHACPNPAFT